MTIVMTPRVNIQQEGSEVKESTENRSRDVSVPLTPCTVDNSFVGAKRVVYRYVVLRFHR
jgi:hypothetical protein